MTLNDILSHVQTILPDATIGEESDGSIVIFTGVKVDRNEKVIDSATDL